MPYDPPEMRFPHAYGTVATSAVVAAVPYPPELVVAEHPYDAPLVGALALGTIAARERLTRGAPAWAG